MSLTRKSFWTAVAVAVCFSTVALAQQRPDAGSILEQQQQRERLPPAPSTAPVLPQVTPAKPAMAPSSTVRVTVKAFRFSGSTVIPAAELATVVQEYVGKTLNFNELNDAAGRVQRYYRGKGYFLAVAYLPQQEIGSGTVEIAVLEGRLGSVNLQTAPGTRLKQSFAQGMLDAHLKPGDVVTEKSLERPLLLMQDLPGIAVSSALGPNPTQVGAADLTVRLTENPRRVTGYVDFDNGGNRFTGEYRLGLNLNASNITGYGDLLSFRGFVSDENMKFGRISYVIPVLHHGTKVGVSYTYFDYRLEKEFAALQAHGEGEVAAAYVSHPLLRTRNANFLVQLGVEEKKLRDRVDSAAVIDDKKVSSTRLGGAGDFRDGLFSGGLNSYAVNYTAGTVRIENAALLAADQAAGTGLRTSGSFSKINLDARRLQRISDNFSLLVAASAQAASKNLSASEKISLGGPNGVRAYPVGEAPGDDGFLFTTELRYVVPRFTLLGGEVTASVFYDMGRMRTNEQPLAANVANNRSIAGMGLGLSVGREGNYLVRASIATPTENETAVSDTAKRDPRLWLQAVKWF